jgi:hypothetical protein
MVFKLKNYFNMKALISIVLVTFCCCSNQNKVQKTTFLNYKLILLAHTVDSSSVAFKRDSVFILHKYLEEKQGIESYYDWYKIPAEKEWSSVAANLDTLSLYYGHQIIQPQKFDSLKIALESKKTQFYFTDIFNPSIDYAEGKKNIIDSFKNKQPDCNNILFHKSDIYNFYSCRGLDNPIFIYYDNDKLAYKFQLMETSSIRDFFLYDITGDTRPELILILNSPMTSIEKGVEIRVYSQTS